MKKLNDYKKDYYFFTSKTSEINRSLIISGIAIIWIFNKTSKNNVVDLPSDLVLPLSLFFLSLFVDLLHYFIGGLIWYLFYKYNECNNLNDDDDVTAPEILPIIIHILYFTKITLSCFGFYCLISFLLAQI